MSYEVKVEDVEYARHAGTPLLARLYRPQGTGPFPDHGRAARWRVVPRGSSRRQGDPRAAGPERRDRGRARLAAAAGGARIPRRSRTSTTRIRWLKARAHGAGGPARHGGLDGQLERRAPGDAARHAAVRRALRRAAAAGGLAGRRRHRALRDHVLARHRSARPVPLREEAQGRGPPYPPLVDEVLPCHDAYWQTEEAMAEGCPALALERGEKVAAAARRSTCRAPRTSPIPDRSSIASSRPIARRAAWSTSSCSTARARASSCARPARRPPIARSR